MIRQITKEFGFSYGHVLPLHYGKCQRMHGHNAVLKVTVGGQIQQEIGTDKGMLMDFGDIKDIVKKQLLDQVDHRFLANGDEYLSVLQDYLQGYSDDITRNLESDQMVVSRMANVMAFVQKQMMEGSAGYHVERVNVVTTAENLAEYAFHRLARPIEINTAGRVFLSRIEWWETPESWAAYTLEPDRRISEGRVD